MPGSVYSPGLSPASWIVPLNHGESVSSETEKEESMIGSASHEEEEDTVA